MATSEEIEYVKDFLSVKGKVNPFNNNFHQESCEEDNSLRYKIQSKFDVYGINGMGYDGKQLYKWCVGDNIGPRINEEESVKYSLTYSITKSGKLEDLSENCDLEDFLLTKGFKKIE